MRPSKKELTSLPFARERARRRTRARAKAVVASKKPFRLARVLMHERACARTRPRRGGNGYCAAPSLRYARVRVRTSDFIRIFFSFGETDKIIQKIVLFSPFEKKSEYFCLPIIYRPYVSLALYPLAPSTCCPV